jgi:hypothetical protein
LSAAALASLVLSLATPDAISCASQAESAGRLQTYRGAVDYFPPGVVDAARCAWFSEHLFSLEEAPLTSDGAIFRLRFLELPALDYPMSITVTYAANGAARIEARATNGLGGAEPGKLVYREQATLSPDQVEFLIDEIARVQLCQGDDDSGAAKPEAEAGAGATRNVFEWASGDTYCLRHADARDDSALSKLAIWLVQRVYAFDVTPPPLRP